jgi:preprotein translocase subunit SecF
MFTLRPSKEIDFVGKKTIALIISLVFVFLSILLLIIKGPNYGIDFIGGTIIDIRFEKDIPLDSLRMVLDSIGLKDAIIQPSGKNEYLIRTKTSSEALKGIRQALEGKIVEMLKEKFEIRQVEMVGPKVGKDLKSKGLKAMVFVLIGLLIYISWRFEFRFAVGAILALIHDVLITLGAFIFSGREFNLPIVAALLTILGYSINDTIVVYDRIRENMKKTEANLEKIINHSINETLSRTILTSFTTVIAVLMLLFFGEGVVKDLSFTLTIGIIVGTYSSIYIASPIVILFEKVKRK